MSKSYPFKFPRKDVLTGLYLLNEGTGTSSRDYSVNGYTATLTGTPTWNTTGLALNGSSQYATISNSAVDIQSDLTVFMRLNKTNTAGNNDDRIFDFTDDANNSFQLTFDNSSGKWLCRLSRAGSNTINQLSYGTFTTGAWITIGYTVSGTTGAFYLNGSAVTTDGSGSVGISGSTYNIGRRGDSTPTAFLTGSIAAWGIWQGALSAADHAYIHQLATRKAS